MRLNEWLHDTYHCWIEDMESNGIPMYKHTHIHTHTHDSYIRERLVCMDGKEISVQANKYNYCEPRETTDKYSKVEICIDWGKPESISEYCDGENIYGYVPVELVQEIIDEHGGIDIEKSIPKNHHYWTEKKRVVKINDILTNKK